jgi:hypothetical protein
MAFHLNQFGQYPADSVDVEEAYLTLPGLIRLHRGAGSPIRW